MTERNIGMELDRTRYTTMRLENAEDDWKHRWKAAQALLRLRCRTKNEMMEKQRQSSADVEAIITLAMANHRLPVGYAWKVYSKVRALCRAWKVRLKILDREHWAEVRRY